MVKLNGRLKVASVLLLVFIVVGVIMPRFRTLRSAVVEHCAAQFAAEPSAFARND